jgi:hypothetical protein
MSIAKIIAEQLGGIGRIRAMLGATVIREQGDGLKIRWPSRTPSKGNCVVVRLCPSDTYEVTFWSIRNLNCKVVAQVSDVYADDLVNVFEAQTGYRLRLV